MLFEEVKPFVRYIRILNISLQNNYPEFLPQDCRLFFVNSGEGKIRINKNEIILNAGDMLLINAGCPYQIIGSDSEYLAVNFDYTQARCDSVIPLPPINTGSITDFPPIERVHFEDIKELNSFLHINNVFSTKNLLFRMLTEYEQKLPYHEMTSSSLLSEILVFAIRKTNNRSCPGNTQIIEKILNYLHTHYNENITNAQIGSIFHLHPNYINKLFRQQLGTSLHKYLIDIRISNAITMLENDNSSIEEIAQLTGFYDSSYFSRYFKKITGVSPKAYR